MNAPSSSGALAPNYERRGPAMIAGLCERYSFTSTEGIPEQWRRFSTAAARLSRRVGTTAYGVMLPVPGSEGFDYLTGLEVENFTDLPDRFGLAEIPAGYYAVFAYTGHVSGIKAAWDGIWTRWLPQSGRRITDSPVLFEEYGGEFDPVRSAGRVRLYLPVSEPDEQRPVGANEGATSSEGATS